MIQQDDEPIGFLSEISYQGLIFVGAQGEGWGGRKLGMKCMYLYDTR